MNLEIRSRSGLAVYAAIPARMQEAEEKSDEYYALFMEELKKTEL